MSLASHVVRMRGLPFRATDFDIKDVSTGYRRARTVSIIE
jgi:hypothetical protein